mmetsp:Transcript_11818/g.24100  ORF Transcript_11818/g.24100 Transcript_11818/m.24100 type:complete len:94 (-) Transcript_11818:2062-2343(-)
MKYLEKEGECSSWCKVMASNKFVVVRDYKIEIRDFRQATESQSKVYETLVPGRHNGLYLSTSQLKQSWTRYEGIFFRWALMEFLFDFRCSLPS